MKFTGEYNRVDPVSAPDEASTTSAYAYVTDQPTLSVDPTGEIAQAMAASSIGPDSASFSGFEMFLPPGGGGTLWALPFPISACTGGIDQGVDCNPGSAVRAIGNGQIYYHCEGSCFGGGDSLYEHLDYPARINGRTYYNIYYAEQNSLVVSGDLYAGQPVMATGLDEVGFADKSGKHKPQGPDIKGCCTPNGRRYTLPTKEGHDFYDFLGKIQRSPNNL
jgi:hypothetical protein